MHIGREHPGHHSAIGNGVRGVGHGDVEQCNPFARLGRQLPESGRTHRCGGVQFDPVAFGALGHKAEDAMFARIDARGEGGPGDGGFRSDGGSQIAPTPARLQRGQGGQCAILHPGGEDAPICAIKADDEQHERYRYPNPRRRSETAWFSSSVSPST